MSEPRVHQITNYEFDERFYQIEMANGKDVAYAPSVTYVLGSTLKDGSGLERWRGDVGNQRADQIIEEAGAEGGFFHSAAERLLAGEGVDSDEVRDAFNPRRSLKILRYLKRLQMWFDYWQPEILDTEYITWHPDFIYAGTTDLKCKIDLAKPERHRVAAYVAKEEAEGKKPTKQQRELCEQIEGMSIASTTKTMVVDLKTSNNVWLSHRLQAVAYLDTEDDCDSAAILHLDADTKTTDPTKGTIAGTSFLVLDKTADRLRGQWQACLQLFQQMHPDARPTLETFPETFKLAGLGEEE